MSGIQHFLLSSILLIQLRAIKKKRASRRTYYLSYAEVRSFTDERELFEQKGIIPEMEKHPIFYAAGSEEQNKTITFRNDSGWYKIGGSWMDSYEAVVELMEWFWDHPLDFEMFAKDKEDMM